MVIADALLSAIRNAARNIQRYFAIAKMIITGSSQKSKFLLV